MEADLDLMEAAAIFMAWSGNSGDAVSKAEYVDRTLRDISDVAMPRRGLSRRPFTYWWNQEIAELRRNCNVRRRRLTRARARRGTLPTEIQGLWSCERQGVALGRRSVDLRPSYGVS